MNAILSLGGRGGGGGGGGGNNFYNNFYETHFILHFNRKWEREFKSDIPDMRTYCIHVIIISHQCYVLVILLQERFPKEKGN